MTGWKKYRRIGYVELRRYVSDEDMKGITVSPNDQVQPGGFIARDPLYPDDQWYINERYVRDNYVCME